MFRFRQADLTRFVSLRRRITAALLCGMVLLLGACQPHVHGALYRIAGLMPSLAFRMTSDRGQSVTARTYRNKVVLLYFGYTHCTDACPTTLARLSRAVRLLGREAGDVRILFVTVDPARDTLSVLRRYVAAFGPEVVGLRGSPASLETLARRYRVVYEPGRSKGELAHSSGVFMFDARGKAQWLAPLDTPAQAIAQAARGLLARRG
ncbi:MAG: SCO family protein [Betaproteobacteria bacterium]|nr:SCO family protein [Betaproteobacteria bacterium]